MKLGTRRYEDVVILQFIGELGSEHLPALKRRLDSLLEGGDLKFVLDAKQLNFVNSAGLGYLIRFAKEAKKYGGHIVLAAPSQFIRDTLITLQITDFFPTYDSIREGVLHFREGADVSELDLHGMAAAFFGLTATGRVDKHLPHGPGGDPKKVRPVLPGKVF